jgi:hypothetical protein
MTRPPSERRSKGSRVRINRQLAVTLMAKTRSQWAEAIWAGARAPQDGGIAHRHVQASEALIKRWPERVDGFAVGEVERHEGGLAT